MLKTIKFREVLKDTSVAEVITTLKERYGAPVYEEKDRIRTAGDFYQTVATSLRGTYLGFGTPANGQSVTSVRDINKFPLGVRIGEAYGKVYVEGTIAAE